MDKQFTYDWFTTNIPTFESVLAKYKGKQDLHFLEIGCFEGRATCWLLENILTDISSKITVIDPFHPNMFLDKNDIGDYYSRFKNNVHEHADKVIVYVGMSWDYLLANRLQSGKFEFIYVDAGHKSTEVLLDAILSFQYLKVGGIMLFDDYLWGEPDTEPSKTPKIAIDAFIESHKDYLTVIYSGYQVAIIKNK